MENIKENDIYFIYCVDGTENNIALIETNNIINEVQTIKTGKDIDYNYIIYFLKLQNDYKGKPFALTLIDKSGHFFFSNIYSTEKFKYEMIFEYYKTDKNDNFEISSLHQKTLGYKEQFIIFQNILKDLKDDDILNDLFLNSINNLFKGKYKE